MSELKRSLLKAIVGSPAEVTSVIECYLGNFIRTSNFDLNLDILAVALKPKFGRPPTTDMVPVENWIPIQNELLL